MLNKFYQQQQIIMTLLGHYDGKCDGVWGPKCIAAKRAWEMTDGYEPGVPSNGKPFVDKRSKLPKGMSWGYKGLCIVWAGYDAQKVAEILEQKGDILTTEHVRRHVFQDTSEQQQAPVAETYVAPTAAKMEEQQISTLKPFSAPVEEVIGEGPDDSDIGTDLGTDGEAGIEPEPTPDAETDAEDGSGTDGPESGSDEPDEEESEEEPEQTQNQNQSVRRKDWRNEKNKR